MVTSNFLYLFPLAGALVVIILLVLERNAIYITTADKRKEIFKQPGLLKFLMPDKAEAVHKKYMNLLRYTKFKVSGFFKVKGVLFIGAILVFVLVKLTNISIYTKDIYNEFDYRCDLIYQYKPVADETKALEQEIKYFESAREVFKGDEILRTPKIDAENTIKGVISENENQLLIPKATMANKIYYRLYDYSVQRRWNVILILISAFLISFIPEVCICIYNFFAKAESKKELRFLKKLIVINGFIKPVDFMEVLKILIEKSKYHRNMLKGIEEMNKRNSMDNRNIYWELIRNTKDIDTKLFYEKLDQANNYDFDEAVINIENEFKMEKRTHIRLVRKQIELIHALGIVGFMILIVILILYLIIPWIQAYNMNQII